MRTLADGTEKTVYQHGDEFFHYLTDEDGTWLDEKTFLPLTAARRAKKEELRAESEVRRVQATTGLDTLLAPRGAIILVSYPDLAFTSTQAEMRDWAMGENYTYNGFGASVFLRPELGAIRPSVGRLWTCDSQQRDGVLRPRRQ